MTVNKGALAILVHGGTDNWSPQRWKGRFEGVCPDRAVLLLPDDVVRSGGGALRRGVEAAAGRACRLPQSARHLQSRRRRRCADGGPLLARRAAGARGRHRSHRADDGICRAACADAPPAGTLLAGIAARQTLGAEIAVGGGRDLGRHHGAGHARRRRRRCAQAPRLSRRGLEPEPEDDRRHRLLSRRGAVRRVPAADRHPGLPAAADAGDTARSQPRAVRRN